MENTLSDILSIDNSFAKEQITEGIQRWPKNIQTCVNRANSFQALQSHIHVNPSKFILTMDNLVLLNSCVKGLEPLLRGPTDVETEGYSQIYFKGNPWSGINSIPFALIFLSIYKSYIVPAFGLLLPLITWILPFLMLKTFYNIPITFQEYSSILWRMWNGKVMPRNPEELIAAQNALGEQEQEPQPDVISQMKSLAQNAWTLFTFGQAMWQPIQQARHFMKLDKDCLTLGNTVVRVKEVAAELFREWTPWMSGWLEKWIELCPLDGRQAFAFVLETPFWLPQTFRALGRFELLLRLAAKNDVVAAQFVGGAQPILMIQNFGDPSIDRGSRVVSSVRLGGSSAPSGPSGPLAPWGNHQSHAVLTGPNRGGKSSFLRGVLLNVVLAHSFGAVFAEKAQMTPFTWIADGMRLDDTPGKQSMFEREVAFGSAVLQKQGGRGLVLYDELFHSTNPPDAKRTSEIFCDSLWNKTNCLSIISTHVYTLAHSAPPEKVKQLCVAAWKSNGRHTFSYKVQRGICEVSSVDLLLKQFGLL
jgi:hypothetical protein